MNNVISRNKNIFNKLIQNIKKSEVYSDGKSFKAHIEIPLHEKGHRIGLNEYYQIKNGKISLVTEGNLVFVVWEPNIIFDKQQFDYYYSSNPVDGDIFANEIYNRFIDNYSIRNYGDDIREMLNLNSFGVEPSKLLDMSLTELWNIIKKSDAYKKLKEVYDYNMSYVPTLILKDEVYKRLPNRNCIPLMVWDSSTDVIDWAYGRLYGSALMTKKNRTYSRLESLSKDMKQLKEACNESIHWAPVKHWCELAVKNYGTNKEIKVPVR